MGDRLSTARGTEPFLVAFAGGGTAGHVFPGLAVAQQLGQRVLWIGSSRGVEKQLAEAAGVPFRGIPAGKLRRYLSLRNITDVLATIAGVAVSVRILAREKPAFLFSKGGFASVPPVVAAWLRGIPAWTHESDLDAGLATRINLHFCEKVLVSFPETLHSLPSRSRHKVIVTGNPVRGAIYSGSAERGRRFAGAAAGTPLLLVLGGSLGSSFLNRMVRDSLPRLDGYLVVHQTGEKEFDASMRRAGYLPAPFFREELPDILAAADLVVTRSGANTLAELAALGKPSLLVPLPSSQSRGDQLRNAEFFRSHGASVVFAEEGATAESFAAAVDRLCGQPALLAEMGRRARALAADRPDQLIAGLIRGRLGRQGPA